MTKPRRGLPVPARVAPLAAAIAAALAALLALAGPAPMARAAGTSLADVVDTVQPKIVKIYGAGGLQGLEAYQSGFLVSPEGHVLTVFSYVLDTDYITVTLDDGRKYQAQLVGADPRLEIAVLKIEAEKLPHFNLAESVELDPGSRVLAYSNLFGVATGNEPASVLHGIVSARSKLEARRGAFQSPYGGPVYILDAMTNNPGAAGGALTDRRGRLAAMLGKELRSSLTNTWLNYAIPISELAGAVEDIRAGRVRPRSEDETLKRAADPITLALLGIHLVPDVLAKTPPFIDAVRPGSPAERAGLRADDLVVFVGDRLVPSCKTFGDELSLIDRDAEVRVTVLREQELIEVTLSAAR